MRKVEATFTGDLSPLNDDDVIGILYSEDNGVVGLVKKNEEIEEIKDNS
jgi:hypothetical protein